MPIGKVTWSPHCISTSAEYTCLDRALQSPIRRPNCNLPRLLQACPPNTDVYMKNSYSIG